MKESKNKIALGGGCHWCTEAVFQSLKGVQKVEQGYVSSTGEFQSFSEAVIVHFDPEIIPLERLIEIHLHTHKSTSNHSMRTKYRSAVYTFSEAQREQAINIVHDLQSVFSNELITKMYPFHSFKPSREELHHYYLRGPEKPFCRTYIHPKLQLLHRQFSEDVKNE